jgi:hypothetical protein
MPTIPPKDAEFVDATPTGDRGSEDLGFVEVRIADDAGDSIKRQDRGLR